MQGGGDSEHDPERWYTTNLVGIPAGLLGSIEFNAYPQAIHIAGARETHRGLFRLLAQAENVQDAIEKFYRYMSIVFQLHPSDYEVQHAKQRRFRPSYQKLLEGWGFDANNPQGAVLKGWVESRFGLKPTFHRAPLNHFPSDAWMRYLEEKYASRFHNNSIHAQLDLLYEYCQYVIQRFGVPTSQPWVTLWRGVNQYDEPTLAHGQLKKGRCVLRLNNLVSFSTNRERAEEFGDWILEVNVPVVKILLFPGLLTKNILSGEDEVIAIGGHFEVNASYA